MRKRPLTWSSPAARVEPRRGPVRTCVGCRRRAVQHELVRVIRGADGRLVADRSGPGRGAWLCAGSSSCLAEAVRRKAFDRALRAPVSGADALESRIFESRQPNVRDLPAAGPASGGGAGPTTTKTKTKG